MMESRLPRLKVYSLSLTEVYRSLSMGFSMGASQASGACLRDVQPPRPENIKIDEHKRRSDDELTIIISEITKL